MPAGDGAFLRYMRKTNINEAEAPPAMEETCEICQKPTVSIYHIGRFLSTPTC